MILEEIRICLNNTELIFSGSSGCIFLITSLGLTADLIGDHVSSGALIYGLMSLTDKLSNGLAVLFIQDLIPCLPIFSISYVQLFQFSKLEQTTTPQPCSDTFSDYQLTTVEPCSQPPIEVTTLAIQPDNPCYSFYKMVLTVSTSSTSLFGAVFVILLLICRHYQRRKNEKIHQNTV